MLFGDCGGGIQNMTDRISGVVGAVRIGNPRFRDSQTRAADRLRWRHE
jgi:hypothetical protein